MMLLMLFSTVLSAPAYADSAEQAGMEAGEKILDIYTIIKAVATPIATIGIVGSALQLMQGDTKAGEAAKKRIVVIILALVAIWLIPLVVGAGKTSFGGLAWDPEHPV